MIYLMEKITRICVLNSDIEFQITKCACVVLSAPLFIHHLSWLSRELIIYLSLELSCTIALNELHHCTGWPSHSWWVWMEEMFPQFLGTVPLPLHESLSAFPGPVQQFQGGWQGCMGSRWRITLLPFVLKFGFNLKSVPALVLFWKVCLLLKVEGRLKDSNWVQASHLGIMHGSASNWKKKIYNHPHSCNHLKSVLDQRASRNLWLGQNSLHISGSKSCIKKELVHPSRQGKTAIPEC